MELGTKENFIYILIPIIFTLILIIGNSKKNKIIKMLNLNQYLRNYFFTSFLLILGVSLCFFSLLDPKVLKESKEVEKKGVDIYILIDISKSMLAQDIKPDRLTNSKESIRKVLDLLKGDRIGFIPFSSAAYIQMPLTDDYEMAKNFLEVIDTDMISGGGTNISQAISLAQNSFDKAAEGDKIIIIFSDGEEQQLEALNKIDNMKDVKIYTIGVGTEKGSLIPEYDYNGNITSYVKDNQNKHVISRINKDVLKEIAEKSGGKFYLAGVNTDEAEKIANKISLSNLGSLKKEKIKIYSRLYQYFLFPGLLLILIAYYMEKRRKKIEKTN